MLKITANKMFFDFGNIKDRIQNQKNVRNELEIEIIENLSRIISKDNPKEVFEEARYLISRYLNYLTLYYSKIDILDFMETREHWKLTPDSIEEAAATIVDSSVNLMSSFTGILNSDKDNGGFMFKSILVMIGSINYYEEQISN